MTKESLKTVRNYCFFFSLLTGAAGLAGVVAAAAAGAAGAAPEAARAAAASWRASSSFSFMMVSSTYHSETCTQLAATRVS
jgi:hypothetical protein